MIYITDLPYTFGISYIGAYSDLIESRNMYLLLIEPSSNRVVNNYSLTLENHIECINYATFSINEKDLPHNGEYISAIVCFEDGADSGDYSFVNYSFDYNVISTQDENVVDGLIIVAYDNSLVNTVSRVEKDNGVVLEYNNR